mgnify:CR=1 FL=1
MSKTRVTAEEALAFHLEPTPGKFEVTATVPMTTRVSAPAPVESIRGIVPVAVVMRP